MPYAGAAVLGWPVWRAYRRLAFEVAGESMSPTLEAGDFVLLDPRREARVGDLVVSTRPDGSALEVVKRVASIEEDGRLYLLGDNAEASNDSRRFGPVAATNVVGVVRLRYWPPGRWRTFP